jgi:hypothetical protein
VRAHVVEDALEGDSFLFRIGDGGHGIFSLRNDLGIAATLGHGNAPHGVDREISTVTANHGGTKVNNQPDQIESALRLQLLKPIPP